MPYVTLTRVKGDHPLPQEKSNDTQPLSDFHEVWRGESNESQVVRSSRFVSMKLRWSGRSVKGLTCSPFSEHK